MKIQKTWTLTFSNFKSDSIKNNNDKNLFPVYILTSF